MSLPPFAHSAALSLGVELELQLVNPGDYDLVTGSSDLLHLLERAPFPGNVVPEITESMIEISTSVQENPASLLDQLRAMRNTLVDAADRLNLGLSGGGAHPFQSWPDRRIFPKPRFYEVSALYGYLAKQFTVFGQHIHVGCSSGNDALYLLHGLSRYIPHFIALAASSPFLQGRDTLFQSSRLNSVFAFPMSGRAPFFLRWHDFEHGYFNRMAATGIVNSMKDFYWDIRPKPEYGTIELRVCDTPLQVETAAALAGYLQAICAWMLESAAVRPAEDDYMVYNYNRFQACRFGLDGVVVHPQSYRQRSIRDDVLETLDLVAPLAARTGGSAALGHIEKIVGTGPDATFLRNQYRETGSLEGMVHAAMHVLRPTPA